MSHEKNSFMIGAKLGEFVARTVPATDKETVKWVFFPPIADAQQPSKAAKFAAIELESGAIGIAFAAYIPKDTQNLEVIRSENLVGHRAHEFIPLLGAPDSLPAQRTIAMAVVNALSTGYMQQRGLADRIERSDAVDAMEIKSSDIVGMVGMFPPLIGPVSQKAAFLHVIELKPHLVQSHEKWDVLLDSTTLRKCNKILVTGTVLLNGTLHSLLDLIAHAEIAALVGPTASFLPEPLFDLGFNIVGGSMVLDPSVFKDRITSGRLWEGVEKFVMRKGNWPPRR